MYAGAWPPKAFVVMAKHQKFPAISRLKRHFWREAVVRGRRSWQQTQWLQTSEARPKVWLNNHMSGGVRREPSPLKHCEGEAACRAVQPQSLGPNSQLCQVSLFPGSLWGWGWLHQDRKLRFRVGYFPTQKYSLTYSDLQQSYEHGTEKLKMSFIQLSQC